MTKLKNKIELFGKEFDVYESLPLGWRELRGARTAPKGYTWIYNQKELSSGDRKSGFIKTKNL